MPEAELTPGEILASGEVEILGRMPWSSNATFLVEACLDGETARGIYKRVIIRDDRLIGAVLYGDTQDGAWYFDLIREGRDVRHLRDDLLFGAGSEHVAAA